MLGVLSVAANITKKTQSEHLLKVGMILFWHTTFLKGYDKQFVDSMAHMGL